MKQPWHTPGYIKLSHAMVYLMTVYGVNEWHAVDVLIAAGRRVRFADCNCAACYRRGNGIVFNCEIHSQEEQHTAL